ncbi:MAG: hypothetical protein ACRDOY_08945 [Nocardioidaceae bacterium]
MKLYADVGPRRAAQLIGDLLLVLWAVGWTWFGLAVHDAVAGLGSVGQEVAAGSSNLSGYLRDAGQSAASVPVVGDALQSPFDNAAGAAGELAAAGRTQQEVAEQLGLLLGVGTAIVPIALVAMQWIPRRVAFARRAGAAKRHLDTSEDLDLFALRALAGQPMHKLARVSDDPAGAWRSREPAVVHELAKLELADTGLRLPARLRG